MSYFTVDENMIMEKPPVNNPRHTGKPHSPQAKKKISNAQKLRYQQMRQAAQSSITEERMQQIIKTTIDEYIAKNAMPVQNNNRTNIPI